jgi:hypothetical protein
MITPKSNIDFLIALNAWRRDVSDTQHMPMPAPTEIGLHIDFAIQSLKELLKEQQLLQKEKQDD